MNNIREWSIYLLKTEVEQILSRLIPVNEKFALLDVPDHDNVGDSAIFMGTLACFKTLRIKPSMMTTHWSPEDEDHLIGDAIGNGTILLHGGGNFGDLWPSFQAYRERIIKSHPNNKIIQLPQSLHFESAENLKRAAKVINDHPNFTLLVRDNKSYELAKTHFNCKVIRCPDMAFCLGDLSIQTGRYHREEVNFSYDFLLHLRNDKEVKQPHVIPKFNQNEEVMQADWPADTPGFMRKTKIVTLLKAAVTGNLTSKNTFWMRILEAQGAARLKRGIHLLAPADVVITDRLHGHILSFLLGIPHVVLDNSYGKTSGFMSLWQTKVGDVQTADSVEQAIEIAREIYSWRSKNGM